MSEHPRRTVLIVLPLVVAIGLAVGLAFNATGDDADNGRPNPETYVDPVDVQLAGRTFVSTDVEGHTLVADTEIHLAFEGDVMAVNAGCNTMMGPWTDEDDQLAWDGEPAMTRKACPEELGAQDQWISDLLSDGMDISRGDADLTLESGDVTIEFDAEEESGADALLGRTWTVVGVIDDGRVSRLPDDATSPTLTVADDGTVAVDTGCNTGRTSVEIHESTVEFDTTAITLKACEPPADAVERTVLTVLDGTAQKVTDGSVLVLTRGDRGLVLDVQ